jgi:hypothetical protein
MKNYLNLYLTKIFLTILFISLLSITVKAQSQNNTNNVIIDKNGVMRWKNSEKEITGFGVNYTVPFAHAYRSAKKLGIDPKKAIENDVYHFSRLGFNLYRVHVWDTQISDTLGNLIQNEYLDTFDFLLKKLQEKGIKAVITPIAFWGNGWPEPDIFSPGFSHKYGKTEALTNENAIKAQQNYLFQFLNHINPYTGIAYKNDPSIIAFEVSNEPHHKGEAKNVTQFVNKMVTAIKKTGTKKPIFYNISHGVHFAEAYFKGKIDGGTFQWYPTGLGYQRELSGNLLPNVNSYNIPFNNTIKKYKGAKLVYEFDAADVNKSYIYPVMARSFREAGIQIATHFSYDPTFLAYANTEYNTHYMNLAYTPQKALSLMIAAKVFETIPMYTNFGMYPNNTTFGNVTVNYENDLAEYNTDTHFIYTNNTKSIPKKSNNLSTIAGFGTSDVVNYSGFGAYFLDKIENGLWRLEVMPDAVLVDNPFGRNSLNKTVSVIQWNTHKMGVFLPNLGNSFAIEGINNGNTYITETTNGEFLIKPGTYLLKKSGLNTEVLTNSVWGNIRLNDFYAPQNTVDKVWYSHTPITEASENKSLQITVNYISPNKPQKLEIMAMLNGKVEIFPLTQKSVNTYKSTINKDFLQSGFLNYYVLVTDYNNEITTYPAGEKGKPFDWDFYNREAYKTRIVPQNFAINLFEAAQDAPLLVREWRSNFKLVPIDEQGKAAYEMPIEKLFVPDDENLNAKPIYDYSFKHFVLNKIEGRKADLKNKKELIFTGNALNNKPCKLQIAIVLKSGAAYGKIIELQPEAYQYTIKISDLNPVKTVTLPRPYPTFLPYYLEHNIVEEFDITQIESLQFSIGPGIDESELNNTHGIRIISVDLQ